MVRPKKVRTVDGIVLADNLYTDPKGRPGRYRYKRPDGTFRGFPAATPMAANRIAEDANKLRDQVPIKKKDGKPGRDQLSYYTPKYIAYRESVDPKLKGKSSWTNRSYAISSLGRHFDSIPIGHIDRETIENLWLSMSHHQQKLRHAEFRKLFNWLMGQGLCPRLEYNPFTTADDRPRLYLSGAEDRSIMRINIKEFWKIYHAAGDIGYPALQIAMGISLTTFMREGDICGLKIDDNLRNDLLKKVIGKSYEQKGSSKAARLSWDQTNYTLLRQLIARGLQLSLTNKRCPYLISHTPKRRVWNQDKTHICQVLPRRLGDMYTEARIEAKVQLNPPEGRRPSTFHQVRSLASKLALDAGYELKDVQHAMAHENENTTKVYQDEHDLPFQEVPIIFTKDLLGGDFG